MKLEHMLFRYRPYNEGDKSTLDAFEKDRLYFSTPSCFNDPFDTVAFVDKERLLSSIRQELDQYLPETLDKKINNPFSPINSEIAMKTLDVVKNTQMMNKFNNDVLEMVERLKKHIIENSKIICFSEEYLSILMWSHYAHNHEGFLLGYEKEKLKQACIYDKTDKNLAQKMKLQKVEYSSVMPDCGQFFYDYIPSRDRQLTWKAEKSFYIKMIRSKMDVWSYEKEWRLCSLPPSLDSEDQATYINIQPSIVFLGAKMDENARQKIYHIAKKKGIAVCEVWLNDSTAEFKLNFCKYRKYN